VSSVPSRRPSLLPPGLAQRIPHLRQSALTSLAVAGLTGVVIVAQAVALATAVERSLLHHATLGQVTPDLIVVGAALVVRALLSLLGELSAQKAGDVVVSSLQRQLLDHALALGPSWLAGERAGELSLTATRGVRALHTYFARYLPQAAMAAVVPIVLLAWVASQDWLSLVVVVGLVLAVPLTMIYFGREATKRSARQWRRLSSLAGRFLALIEGLPTLRAFGREGQGRREIEAATDGVRTATMRTLRVAFLSALAMDLIAGFGVGFVAMVLGLRLLWGQLTLQTALAVLLVAPDIFVPLRRAGAEFHASTEGQAAVARILDVLDTEVPAQAARTQRPAAARTTDTTLAIEDLRVVYPHRDRPALEALTLHAAPGARLALTGPSGAGKSTVLSALLGFTTVAGGTLRVGDTTFDAADPAQWRTSFSWLPQRPYLFSASLADNLRLGAPDVSDDRLNDALETVGLVGLVSQWSAGLQTAIGPGGLTLSAGERQRVALARALLCSAPILLLDEPTASLDVGTTTAIGAALEPWLAGRTVLVAAHSPVLLSRYDDVVELGSTHPVAP
jgi:thiol reductant ABC exporter CydD subunit